ncbi:putative peptidoglycan binding domain protein [Hoeflea phototrophica DFL-43]|uniref:Putative peptidoglycan binding domain protein n=1 Tax=Hoeflea phototrophica (strain DSM 17068 / NCIMB 14078 / DFL-43) TaxID=411684 RepID=A9D3U2_HOEPD|nr:peptidoglycan-binding domain-containing protein [Hoeflea phototrophica]EDQ33744.2 putative peptidoglycan binding domain protein [Hoeflea phototrophica DFL-43]
MPRQRSAPELYDADAFKGRGVLGTLGRLVSAHPSLAGGTVAFTVIFSFISANALWSQPGNHPAPILKTREVGPPTAHALTPVADTAAPAVADVPARSVTTFRIERSDETSTASIPVPNIAPAPAPAMSPATTSAAAPALLKADPVLARIQEILAARGLYSGEIDGLMGPKSAAGIRAWEKANGYVETGEPTSGLLAVMDTPAAAPAPKPAAPVAAVETVSLEVAPTPTSRPKPVAGPTVTSVPAPAIKADQVSGEAVTEPAPAVSGVSELVRQIQSGLSNIAYADITVDGVAGTQTKSAIRAFEKHYRLPVTGEPNQTVLNKLLEIGAL